MLVRGTILGGSAAMGKVVDGELQVAGAGRLRMCDVSVFPVVVAERGGGRDCCG